MKSKLLLALTIIAVLLFCLFINCGIPKDEYDKVNAKLIASQAQNNELQEKYYKTTAQLSATQSEVIQLQKEIIALKEQYELVGSTPAETAQNIVKHYHETHIYTEYDFFACSDMALDVWDMLKAQGINALIQIGNVETMAKDVTEANHAWVLAETTSGKYLALETTAGYAVWDNPLYYRGWSFDNPRDYKRFVELKQEYNIRVSLVKELNEAIISTAQTLLEKANAGKELLSEIDRMSVLDPSLGSKLGELIKGAKELGEYEGRCDQLNELMSLQKQELENIVSEMKGLTG